MNFTLHNLIDWIKDGRVVLLYLMNGWIYTIRNS